MTAALTPSLALAYLRELSADIRAAIVLDPAGRTLAGPDRLAAPARALLAEGALVGARAEGGAAFGARDDRHAVVAVTGPFALPRVVLHDLTQVLAALGGDAPGGAAGSRNDVPGGAAGSRGDAPGFRGGTPIAASTSAAEALLSALRSGA